VAGRFLIVICVLAAAVFAGALSVDDLINLKKAGFSESEVRREVERTGTRLQIGDAEAKRLRDAGFSGDFVQALRSAGAANGVTMRATGKKATKVGRWNATLFHGTHVLPDGTTMNWETLLVPTRGGVRGIMYTGSQQTWKRTEAYRRVIFEGFEVFK